MKDELRSCPLKGRDKVRHRLRDSERYFRIKKEEPWKIVYWNVKKRCRNDSGYKKHGMRLTLEHVIDLWFRDKAWQLKRPSIDRINNDLGYFYDNCQFIELGINSVKDKRRSDAKR